MSFRCFLATCLVLSLPALLQAQYYPNRRAQQPGWQPAEFQGTIQTFAKGGLVVACNNNQMWKVAILPATQIHVTGATTADALRSNLIVEFTADIDARGAIQGKIDKLTITSLTKDKTVGLTPAAAEGADDDQGGFGANLGGPATDAGTKPAKPPAHAAKKTNSRKTAAGRYQVVGRLIVGRGSALSVQPGHGALAFQLAEQPEIKIDMADFSLVRPGNQVSVQALVMPSRPGVAQAVTVKVKLPEPPGGEKKSPADRPEAKKPAMPPN